MSTIEEAREQARKVVLDAAWAQFMRMPSSNPSDYAHAVIKALETRGQAPALLDATEPRPITDEMVEAAAGADFEFGKESMTWDAWAAHDSDHAGWLRKKARAALEAAEEARR